ncbi:MAG: GNAT family N-acetyltransferase [Planctomycetota bacterium]
MRSGYQAANREQAEAQRLLCTEAFGGDPSTALDRLDDADVRQTRVVVRDNRVAAALYFYDVAQFVHGRRLRSWAIGGLVTHPAYRSRGVGRELTVGMLQEAKRSGVPLCVLYASTPTFYRKCGFEPAGDVCAWGAPSHHLPVYPKALDGFDVVPFEPDDDAVRACYLGSVENQNGPLDRDDKLWEYKLAPHQGHRFRYRFDHDGQTEAYVSLSSDKSDGLAVEDYAATTLRARRAVLAFLHGHRSVNGKVVWYGGPHDPLRRLIPENAAFVRPHTEEWLLRLTDPIAALGQRGYPALDTELNFDLADASMPENQGRFTLRLSQGQAAVTPGGDGRLRVDVRGLAALLTSQRTAEELAAVGLIGGPVDDLAVASQAFAGPRPFMVDKF